MIFIQPSTIGKPRSYISDPPDPSHNELCNKNNKINQIRIWCIYLQFDLGQDFDPNAVLGTSGALGCSGA